MDKKRALEDLHEIEKRAKEIRLAADGWDSIWKTTIATLMSARTLDRTTIPVAEELFNRYDSLAKLSKAKVKDVEKIIKRVNFYKNKSRNVINLAKIASKKYGGELPLDFEKLVELPGVGRKTANVVLAEYGHGVIGVDTHVNWISKQMGWTKHDKQHLVEKDLQEIFPKESWGRLNWILVRFGQTYPNRKDKLRILGEIRNG